MRGSNLQPRLCEPRTPPSHRGRPGYEAMHKGRLGGGWSFTDDPFPPGSLPSLLSSGRELRPAPFPGGRVRGDPHGNRDGDPVGGIKEGPEGRIIKNKLFGERKGVERVSWRERRGRYGEMGGEMEGEREREESSLWGQMEI